MAYPPRLRSIAAGTCRLMPAAEQGFPRREPTMRPQEPRSIAARASTLLPALLLAFVVLVSGVGCNRTTSDRSIVYKRPAELMELANTPTGAFGSKGPPKVLWLDPRTPAEFAAGRVPQATNIPFPDIERTHEATCRGFDLYIVYDTDYDDVMAKAAAKRLIELGYEPVYAMLGGLRAWRTDGFSVDPPAAGAKTE
ncbi:MAG: hypothetical protein GC172_12865 [Phycisphaera sp.]|nr:hypothetical protein [Phycisphaera sp.]